MMSFENSEKIWRRGSELIPCGTQTLSKAPNQFVAGMTPKYLERGFGSRVWDVDGNEFIDYPMALGAIILGHAYGPVVKAVQRQIESGTLYTLMHPLEVEVAELLVERIPCAEQVRFGKNGSDATTAAVRAARALTGRDRIAYCGYHGWHDWYAVTTERGRGIPVALKEVMHPFSYNDPGSLAAALDSHPGEFAAVILEHGGDEPRDRFLHKVKELAHAHGALMILDEIVTGFRYAPGGVQELFGVTPDLACFGKGMANGFPISAVVGKRDAMKALNEVFFSMTFGGETASLAAAAAVLKELSDNDVCGAIWEKGKRLMGEFNRLSAEFGSSVVLSGAPPRMGFSCKDPDGRDSLLVKSLFLQETVRRGILFGGPVFPTYSHSDEDIDRTLEASRAALKIVAKGVESGDVSGLLEGDPVSVVFRPKPPASEAVNGGGRGD